MQWTRSSGILLHPTSLPGPQGMGCLDLHARQFVDCLAQAGQSWWQILPLNPPGHGGSPYSSSSAFGGSPALVDLEPLVARGWLAPKAFAAFLARFAPQDPERCDVQAVVQAKGELLGQAAEAFFGRPGGDGVRFEAWADRQSHWLDDYALYAALKSEHRGKSWQHWSQDLVRREPAALCQARSRLAKAMAHVRFAQWVFEEQWLALRQYARERGVRLIGDVPIFVDMDSADVWARRELFQVGPQGQIEAVAGVPPDYFSATGQRWGNPLYDWQACQAEGYAWWVARMSRVLELVDIARIDHFRAFAAYWRIPAEEPTAVRGKWVAGPGDAFFEAIGKGLGEVPVIAEDLGIITPDVEELRDRQGLAGMKVLQFAFDGNPEHPMLPHRLVENCVAYTGTHDNDTTQGWYDALDEGMRHQVRRYFHSPDEGIVWRMIESLLRSTARLTIFPLQDIHELSSQARMNRPGVAAGNWNWRLRPELLEDARPWVHLAECVRHSDRWPLEGGATGEATP